MTASLNIEVVRTDKKKKHDRVDMNALKDPDLCETFRNTFCVNINLIGTASVDEQRSCIRDACKSSAARCLPLIRAVRKRPWISYVTLKLIDMRDDARRCHDYATDVF